MLKHTKDRYGQYRYTYEYARNIISMYIMKLLCNLYFLGCEYMLLYIDRNSNIQVFCDSVTGTLNDNLIVSLRRRHIPLSYSLLNLLVFRHVKKCNYSFSWMISVYVFLKMRCSTYEHQLSNEIY